MNDAYFLKKVDISALHTTQTHLGYCGHRQLKLLTTTWVNNEHLHLPLKSRSTSRYSRHTGQMLPQTFLQQATHYGLSCCSGAFIGSSQDALLSIKKHLHSIQKPIVVVIGHGSKTYTPLEDALRKNILLQHRVSIWGYDDEYIYVYDSTMPENHDLPTGNIALTYDQFLHYRKRGYVGLRRHNAILIY